MRTADIARGSAGCPGSSEPRIPCRRAGTRTAWPQASNRSDRGPCRHDLQARVRRVVEAAHLAERISRSVPRPQLWLTLPVQPSRTSRASSSSTCPSNCASGWRTVVLAVGMRALYARSVRSLTGCSDPGVIRRSQRAERSPPVTTPCADRSSMGGGADPRGPIVVLVVGRVDRVRLLERPVSRPVGVENHHPHVGDRIARRRQQQRLAQPQRLRPVGVVGADVAALVVGAARHANPASRLQHPILER